MSDIVLTYKYRLLPTRRQHAALSRLLEDQRQLYNAALEERIGCYRKTGRGRTYVDQCAGLTEWRRSDSEVAALPLSLQRWTIKRVDDAYKGFFRRQKEGQHGGFPRFRGKGRWTSFGFSEFHGIALSGARVRFHGMPGSLRFRKHRELPPGKPLTCIFSRDAKGWSVCFQMRVACRERSTMGRSIGIDVGLTTLATLSSGETIPNPRHARRVEREMRRRQRAVARCKRGSARREKAKRRATRLHAKVANARSTRLHQISAGLIRRFDTIAIEKLNLKGLAASRLAKSVHDAAWGRLRQLLAYKAEYAGCELIEIDPRHTSQACSGCGVIVPKGLSVRMHSCADCGLTLDRDHNAALNILRAGVAARGAQNVAGYSEHAPGNIGRQGRDATFSCSAVRN